MFCLNNDDQRLFLIYFSHVPTKFPCLTWNIIIFIISDIETCSVIVVILATAYQYKSINRSALKKLQRMKNTNVKKWRSKNYSVCLCTSHQPQSCNFHLCFVAINICRCIRFPFAIALFSMICFAIAICNSNC